MTDLLLETATDTCSVALAQQGELVAEATAEGTFRHASHLTLLIGEVMAGWEYTDLDRIVLSDGPGSYTSLRVGAATAKGLCVALPGVELYSVATLAALAEAVPAGLVLATINSRRGEVYGQFFRDHRPLTAPLNLRLTTPDWLPASFAGEQIIVTGPGQERVLEHAGNSPVLTPSLPLRPAARLLLPPLTAGRAKKEDAAAYEPFYLNPPFVTKSTKKPLL